jgi:hypothetical protein
MALIDRLTATDGTKIPVHAYHAAIAELHRGKLTAQQVINAFGMSQADVDEATALLSKVIAPPESYALGAYNVLANLGATYDATAPTRGLGWVQIEGLGVTGIELRVKYNKIGTGTLSFQLWDETTSAELCVINDAAAAGDNKEGVQGYVGGLTAGLHKLRVRAKSTVSTDDPVYYGSCLRVGRVDMTSAETIQQVLMLAEAGVGVYTTAASVRTRLGL